MNMIKLMVAMAAAILGGSASVLTALAGDSAPFRLDTREGIRTAREVETITYSPLWNGAASCTVTASATLSDGSNVQDTLVQSATQEGSIGWSRPVRRGLYTLAHAAGGETLTAQFEVLEDVPLTLEVESANWSSGSITLRCTDADTSDAEHEYSLMYYEEAEPEKKWYEIYGDGSQQVKSVRETTSDGKGVWVSRLTDERFAKRMNGVRPVTYRVVDENGRTADCETRHRHGLFVAIDEYEYEWCSTHRSHLHQASVFRSACYRYGGAFAYGRCFVLEDMDATKLKIFGEFDYLAENVVKAGDIFMFYYVGHGGSHAITCYRSWEFMSAEELLEQLHKFSSGVGIVVLLNTCHSAGMITKEDVGGSMGNIAWLVSAQADETSYCGVFNSIVCDKGWFDGRADIVGGNVFADGNGFVTFGELAAWGQQEMAGNQTLYDGRLMTYYNSLVLDNIVAGNVPSQSKPNQLWSWLTSIPSLFQASGGDESVASAMTAANGCRTVGECYALGIDPEDPDDDLKITDFKMDGTKPVITLNHTADGSGNSFEDRVKVLGKAELSDTEWQEVPEDGDPDLRFFKVNVSMP